MHCTIIFGSQQLIDQYFSGAGLGWVIHGWDDPSLLSVHPLFCRSLPANGDLSRAASKYVRFHFRFPSFSSV